MKKKTNIPVTRDASLTCGGGITVAHDIVKGNPGRTMRRAPINQPATKTMALLDIDTGMAKQGKTTTGIDTAAVTANTTIIPHTDGGIIGAGPRPPNPAADIDLNLS